MSLALKYNPGFSGIIGCSQKDITPPIQIYSKNWGAGNDSPKIGIHHRLCLTCLVIRSSRSDQPSLVLISADLGWWNSLRDERKFREELLNEFAIDESKLMFCFSHTHSGPNLFSENSNKPGGELISQYVGELKTQSIAAIREALQNARPATLSWKYGNCNLACNRDQPLGEGSTQLLVGFNPEKEADSTLLVGRVTDDSGKIMATIVNYACHPTTLAWDNKLISPDYVGALRNLVQEHTGGLCLFLQGASGELAPAEQYSGDTLLADKHGRSLGYAVLSVMESMYSPGMELKFTRTVESGANLGVWEPAVRKVPSSLKAEVKWVKMELKSLPSLAEIEDRWQGCNDPVLKERLLRLKGIRQGLGEEGTARIPLWIWQLGECYMIGQPNEAYSVFQIELRRMLAPSPVAVMNLVNGHIGYLPPREAYQYNMYAVWQTPFAAGSLETLISEAKSIAKNLTPSG